MRSLPLVALLLLAASPAHADGPADNLPDNVRPIPPQGDPLPSGEADALRTSLAELQKALAAASKNPAAENFLPDAQIFEKAVRWALVYGERYIEKGRDDAKTAAVLLKTGIERAKELAALKPEAKPTWATATGRVVRGYKSKIDGSVQPYGLVIPKGYDPNGSDKWRLDFWWHGRGEKLTELDFLRDRMANNGEFASDKAITVHPYGRYCNGSEFAGETDTFEVLAAAQQLYRIDPTRLVARGFSLGGAACWHTTVHYPTLWAASAPGAGFAESREFLNNFQGEKVQPEWWEQKLWRMYDATEYAENVFNVPTVAYSGENDRQKQAADVMAKAMKAKSLELMHVIGAKAGHNYTADAKKEINARIDAAVEKVTPSEHPEIKFTTYTLRYNQCDWLTVTGLEKHWEKATVSGSSTGDGKYVVDVKGVTAFTINSTQLNGTVVINGSKESLGWRSHPEAEHRLSRHEFVLERGYWKQFSVRGQAKRPGLQGPIDDAFMDAFLMVRPTGKPMNDKIGDWTTKEMAHATKHWRSQFRGDAPIKDDKDINEVDIKNNNLILWGDPKSNAVLAKIADKLPLLDFDDGKVTLMIYPNPLNPKKYVVLNSGFTFREYDYLNNARQTPKLPDYAVIDTSTPPNSRFPGKVVRAGFFDEQWKLQKDDGRGK